MSTSMPEATRRSSDGVVAYLILSHHRPPQVEALAQRILGLSRRAAVVIHHDAAADDIPFAGGAPPRVHLVPRQRVLWGDWSIVEASLSLMRYAVDELDASWCAFLSGEDRPVVDLERFERDLLASDLDGLVPARALVRRPVLGRAPTAEDINFVRYRYRWRALPPVTGGGRRAVEAARRVSRYAAPLFKIEYTARRDRYFLALPRRRRLPAGWVLYSGPQWIACARRAAQVLLDADPAVVDWFRHTWIPDQSFFHTVLHNRDDLVLSDRPLTYVVPFATKRERGDMVLRLEDLDAIRASGAAFARKFDPAVDAAVLRALDDAVDTVAEGSDAS